MEDTGRENTETRDREKWVRMLEMKDRQEIEQREATKRRVDL